MTRSLCLLLALSALSCKKKVADPGPDPLAEVLPVDPDVLHGTFENGMKWFVEPNGHPADRVVFRLAVDAGSALEDDDQRGLAHLLEHMAFNGTKSFPGTELVTYLESLGTRFGPHLNAHTSFDETVYKLTVPSDDEVALSTALKVLQEWACCMTLDPAEIEKERGVVLEEWRRRLGPGSRITDQTIPLTYQGSPYAERLPIGTEESLRTFTPDAVQRYHADWYRPDRMAIVAVGDIDPHHMATLLKAHFAGLENPPERRERAEFSLPDHEPVHLVITDPEVTRTSVQVVHKHDEPTSDTVGEYRASLLRQVALGAFNERLTEITRGPSPPWLSASSGPQGLMPGETADGAALSAAEGQALTAWEALLTEIARLQRFGLTEPELERSRKAVLRRYEDLLREIETTESVGHADEIVRHFLVQESMPGTAYEVELARRFVPEFTLEEVNRWAAAWMTAPSAMTTVILPAKEGVPAPTVADLKAVEARVAAAELQPPVAGDSITALVDAAPTPGTIVERDTRFEQGLGFTGWTLSNGAKVWFKATDFKAEELIVRAWRDGGMSAVSEADYISAVAAPAIRGNSGLGPHDPNTLARFMKGRRAGMDDGIQTFDASLRGSMAPEDLEVGLQMLHLMMTAPAFTPEGEALTASQWSASLATRENDPNTAFSDAWSMLLWPDDPRSRPFTVEDVGKVDLARARAIHAELFSDPSDFTFVIVGRIPDDFESQVLTWIGGVPATEAGVEVVDRGFRRKPGDQRVVIEKGIEAKARYRTEYWGPLPENTWVTRSRLYALADVLEVQLRERLREELGGVYGVSVGADTWEYPEPGYSMRIEFTCDPGRVDELEKETRAIVARFRETPVEARYVEAEIAKNALSHDEQLRSNGWWLSSFSGALDRGEDPLELLNYDARNTALTAEALRDGAKSWLDDGRRATAVLLPAP